MPDQPDFSPGSTPHALSGAMPGAAGSPAMPAPPTPGGLRTPPVRATDAQAAMDDLGTAESDRYERRQVLGLGGMGRVVLVRDRRLGREVALKEVAPQNAPNAEAMGSLQARLAREAGVTARLEHPGIVPVYDAGRGPDGALFYTMRVVRGRSLHDALHAAPSAAERTRFLRHVLDAAQAVAWAHRHGVVHRDLKPANIMVGEFGETQVVDWGLARILMAGTATVPPVAGGAPPDDPALAEEPGGLTQVGIAIGTPHYMSPEQALGQPADARADVWALGLVLFEVWTGHQARLGSASEAIAAARAGSRPDHAELEHMPSELAAIIRRATEARLAARYADAKELADDLAAYLDGRRVSAHAYSAWQLLARLVRAWRVPLMIGLVALVALVVVVAIAFGETAAERNRALTAEEQARAALAQAELQLGHTLTAAASNANAHDERAEAEILAAAALTHAPSPDARGILAAWGSAARATRVGRVALPDCRNLMPNRDGTTALCLDDRGLSRWDLDAGLGAPERRWTVPGVVGTFAYFEDDARLLLTTKADEGPATASIVDAETGRIDQGKLAFCCSELHATTSGRSAFGRVSEFLKILRHAEAPALGAQADCTTGQPIWDYDDLDERWVGACVDGHYQTFDRVHGLRRGTFASLPTEIHSRVAFVPGRDVVVLGTNKGEVLMADLASGAILTRMGGGTGLVTALEVAPDGGIAAIRDEAPGVRLWDLVSGASRGRLPGTQDRGMRFDANAPRRLRTWNRSVMDVWDLPSDRPQTLPVGGGVTSLELAPNGDRIGLGATTRAEVYRLADGARLLRHEARAVVKSVAFDKTGSLLAAATAFVPEPIDVVDVDAGPVAIRLDPDPWTGMHRRIGFVLGPSAGGFMTVSSFGPLRIYDADGATRWRDGRERAGTDLVAYAHGTRVVALLDEAGTIVELDDLRAPLPRDVAADREWTAVAPSPDGEAFAATRVGRVEVVDRDGALVAVYAAGPDSELIEVAWAPDSHYVAAGARDGGVYLWDAPSGRLVASWHDHAERIQALLFDPAGRWLASGSWDNTVKFRSLVGLERGAAEILAELEAAWGVGYDAIVERTR